ncbi:MAG TPA: PLP-dependent aspartate aminotransferase family protein [Bacillota bacterium]|jgi:methionine-gamma-lyase|nr:PLP-dependent aspartate aminotransferase family protein [Bacillota bacterium]
MLSQSLRFGTQLVHGVDVKEQISSEPLSPPIFQTSAFSFSSLEDAAAVMGGTATGCAYSRSGNPTIRRLAATVARLEGAEAGLAFGSGMAAISAALMTLLRSGDEVVAGSVLYGTTYALLTEMLPRFGIITRFVDLTDPELTELQAAISDRTKVVYLESPQNPDLDIIDIKAVARAISGSSAALVVDNTFATPCLQRPLELGADLVVHSATKYLGGHGDLLAGIVVGSADMVTRIAKESATRLGGVISPFVAWLCLRGIQTLGVRMERHCSNALKVAEFLTECSKVQRVRYPGLTSHPQYELAMRQMGAGGGMITMDLADLGEAQRFLKELKLFHLSVSLGDTTSLAQHPASMTHGKIDPAERRIRGIGDGMIRLSIGLEDADDLIEDIDVALEHV